MSAEEDAQVMPTDAQAQSALSQLRSAAAPDVTTDSSYHEQLAQIGEYAQSAINEVLAQYRFLGLLGGIKGPNDTDEDVEAARNALMEALADFLAAGPIAQQVQTLHERLQEQRSALELDRDAPPESLSAALFIVNEIAPGHPHDQSETFNERMAAQGYRDYVDQFRDELTPSQLARVDELLQTSEQLSHLEDVRRGQRRAATRQFFADLWNGIADYYNENMELIRNGQWLLATGRIAVDVTVFALEEVVVAGIVAAIIGLTGGAAAVMALGLRAAVRLAVKAVRLGTRTVRNVNATWRFRIELTKVQPGVLYSNPSPLSVSIERRVNYDKVIDVEKDLTGEERLMMGEGGQGSTVTDPDGPEPGGVNADDPPPYRHPRDGDTPRSREELLPNGKIPTDPKFESWWDDLSPKEHNILWGNGKNPDALKIRERVLGNRQTHEWLKRSQLNKLKSLGFTMREIQEFVTPTKDVHGPDPRKPGETWRHNPENGQKGSGRGAGTMHKSLDKIIEDARSRADLLRRYGYWANSWLHNGVDDLPPAMRDAILRSGGG